MNSFIVALRRSSGIDCATRPLVGRVNKAGIVGAGRIDEIDEPALARLFAKNAIRGRESFESGSPNVESDEVIERPVPSSNNGSQSSRTRPEGAMSLLVRR